MTQSENAETRRLKDPQDRAALRRALGAFATGVTIVTAKNAQTDEPVGFTANSFTSVSLEPPLLLVCLAHTAASYRVFRQTDSFAVNVLNANQEDVARVFATRNARKFDTVRWHAGLRGAPLIEGSLAAFDCRMDQRITAGDHDILMGEVLGFALHEGQALIYHGGAFASLG